MLLSGQPRLSVSHLHNRASPSRCLLPCSAPSHTLLRPSLRCQAGDKSNSKTEEETDSGSLGDYCSINSQGKRVINRTLGEMEADFLEALSAYYNSEKPKMTDEEFEVLKSELIWSGSKVAILDSDEQRFMEVTMGLLKMPDEEFDELKANLKAKSSIVAAEGPRCSIRSKKMYSDCSTDYVRSTLLSLPATVAVLGACFVLDDITGFEITKILELPPPLGTIGVWLLLPLCYVLASALTDLAFKDHKILKGTCPNCGTENFTFFGDVLVRVGLANMPTTPHTIHMYFHMHTDIPYLNAHFPIKYMVAWQIYILIFV